MSGPGLPCSWIFLSPLLLLPLFEVGIGGAESGWRRRWQRRGHGGGGGGGGGRLEGPASFAARPPSPLRSVSGAAAAAAAARGAALVLPPAPPGPGAGALPSAVRGRLAPGAGQGLLLLLLLRRSSRSGGRSPARLSRLHVG